jgi:hypothetical protein
VAIGYRAIGYRQWARGNGKKARWAFEILSFVRAVEEKAEWEKTETGS